jgi:hypothetical protein
MNKEICPCCELKEHAICIPNPPSGKICQCNCKIASDNRKKNNYYDYELDPDYSYSSRN